MAGAVVGGAVEGALVEHGCHVTVWGERRPQLRVHLPGMAGVGAVEACRGHHTQSSEGVLQKQDAFHLIH